MTRRTRIAVLLLVLVATGGVLWERNRTIIPEPPTLRQAKADFQALAEAIEQADSLAMIEHSAPSDEMRGTGRSLQEDWPPKYEYARINTDINQRRALAAVVRSVVPEVGEADIMCPFVPHHTILVARGSEIRRLRICFTCSQVRWDEVTSGRFDKLAEPLMAWVRSLRMNPNADWRERYQEARRASQ